MSDHNLEKLQEHIINLSVSNLFEECLTEWDLERVEYNDDWDRCPCNVEIKEICHIYNKINDNRTYVGNVCINRFTDWDTTNVFSGSKIIRANKYANPNESLIKYSTKRNLLYQNEVDFLMDTRLKRKLSTKQKEWKRKINYRIIKHIAA